MAAAYGHTKAGVFRSMLRTPGMRREEQEIRELAEKRLAFFGERLMGYRWDQPAYSLSYANRRRLEIARATATNPTLLLLDEPAAGMNPKETQEITDLIGLLRTDGGYTILVIEHDMHVVEGISDRVIALDHGVKIAEGSFEEVATSPQVVEAYLGTGGMAQEMSTNGTPILQLEGINTYYGQIHILQDENIVVHEGELVCLLGGNASGKSTTLKTILGLVRPRTGTVRLAGEDVTTMPTAHRIQRGLAIVPENRRLFGPMTVLENLEMGAYLRPKADLKAEFERVYELFPLLYERRSQLAGTMSGGEQQMVAMGRALMSQPKLLLMDEPSMGLAPVLVERSFEIIKQVNDAGVAMLDRRAERERLALDRRPWLRPLHRARRSRGQGSGSSRERGASQGVPRASDGSRLTDGNVAPQTGSELALERLQLGSDETRDGRRRRRRRTAVRLRGAGTLDGDAVSEAARCTAPAGETATLTAAGGGISARSSSPLGGDTDLHAPIGPRERIVDHRPGRARKGDGQPLLPGAVRPPQRLHPRDAVRRLHPARQGAVALPPLRRDRLGLARARPLPSRPDGSRRSTSGAAFRITPREVHIVENPSEDRELAVLGHLHAGREPVGCVPDARRSGRVRGRAVVSAHARNPGDGPQPSPAASARRSGASSRSSSTRHTSTPARRARSRIASAPPTRSTSQAGTRTGPSGSSGSSGPRRHAPASPRCCTGNPTR